MAIPADYKGKYFYHFTHIKNLDSILKNGFLCTNKKKELALDHTNIASENIQNRRSEMDVTCNPNGKVHDFVPFYFTTRNPMLLSLTNNKNIDQPFLIFFAVSIEKILEDSVVFTDASANTDIAPTFYNQPNDLVKLDWESIDTNKWGCKDRDTMHRRMAEALVLNQVPLDWIETIVVWNDSIKKEVVRIYEKNNLSIPKVQYEPHGKWYFYFTKFGIAGRENETLVTGPIFLKNLYKRTVKKIKKKRKENEKYLFSKISDALTAIEKDFCAIKELKGVFGLETVNDVHSNNVSDHTVEVVENLEKNDFFNDLSNKNKRIVKLSAYLHDIGKGPADKWKDGKQPAYPDHPADSLGMLERILSNDIEDLSKKNIKRICKLVGYHDLLGDIVGNGRSTKELIDTIENETELKMLIALSIADVQAINPWWCANLKSKLPELIKLVKENLE